MMALIGPQLTGGALPVSLYWFHCEAMGREGGGVGEAGFEGNSCWRWHSQEHPCDRPPPSTPLPPSPTPPHPHTQMLHHLLFWRFWFERHFSSSLSSKNSKASGWSLRGWQQVLLTDQLTGVSKFKTSRYSESISVSCQAWEQVSDHRGAAAPDDEKPGVTSFPNNGEHFS